MAQRLRSLWVLPFLMLTHAQPAAAQECDAQIEHAGNVLQGSRVYAHWLISHAPLRWATVSFHYRLTYLDENNRETGAEGRFRQLISGREEEYVELKNLRHHPNAITRTEITDITCYP